MQKGEEKAGVSTERARIMVRDTDAEFAGHVSRDLVASSVSKSVRDNDEENDKNQRVMFTSGGLYLSTFSKA